MPEPVEHIRILLVDDHALFRESVARLLSSEHGFQVVGLCASIEESLETLRREPVDIVLLDFDLGARDGAQFVRLATEQGFEGKVLVVTAGVGEDEAAELIRAGVSGIFMKHQSAALLAQGIRYVMSGKVWFDQGLLHRAVTRQTGAVAAAESERLTSREREVLSGVLEGLVNKEIAARLGVSESSVKATLQQLFSKTGVRSRSQLVRIALEQFPELAAGGPHPPAPGRNEPPA